MVKKFDAFRRRSALESCDGYLIENSFKNATSFCILEHVKVHKDIEAMLIPNRREFFTETIIYTKPIDEVKIGDYLFDKKEKYYLPIFELASVKTDKYLKKFKGIECNTEVIIKDTPVKGFFTLAKGRNGTAYAGEEEFSNGIVSILTFDTDALLIAKDYKNVSIGDNYIIGDRQWEVRNYDNISNKNICYVYLNEVLRTNFKDLVPPEDPPLGATPGDLELKELTSGLTYSFPTEIGYFITDKTVKIVSMTKNEVEIEIPYGINSLEVTTIKEDKIITNRYRVRS